MVTLHDNVTKGSDNHHFSELSSCEDNQDYIYQKYDYLTVIKEVMKVAAPATLSAVLGQVTYVINIIYAGQYGDKN